VIVLSITISISTLAKTEVYFSLSDNPQILSTTFLKPEVHTININTVSQDEFLNILQISEPLARKTINLRNELDGFTKLKDLTKILELTNIDWEQCEEEGIIVNVE
ncbi:MAG: helix-hairpin-helix domain-containing protein, partial [Nitrososphaeraceae archaeon]|nr:helix-hairpin-helix domain-containing protein [Nitrososphaeraceae archaeon]